MIGYRLAYGTADGSAHGEASAARLLGDVLSGVGLDELVGDALAHLPLSRDVLLALGVPPVRPDRVMLRIAYDTARDPELAKVLDSLAGRGYALSLYALPGPDFDAVLLDLFGTVEVDFTTWSHEAAQDAVARIVAGRATPLASGLLDYNKFEEAKRSASSCSPGRSTRAGTRPRSGTSRSARWARSSRWRPCRGSRRRSRTSSR